MRSIGKVFAVALLVTLATGAIAAPAAAQENTTDADGNETLTIGQQISLIAKDSTQGISSQVHDIVFQNRFRQAENKSQVAQERVQELHSHLMDAQEERQRLVHRLRNGSITPSEFATQITTVNRDVSRIAKSMNDVEETANRTSLEVNATEGLNQSLRNAVDALKNRAAANVSVLDNAVDAHGLAQRARSGNFTGPEIADFAKQFGLNRTRAEGVPGGPGNGAGMNGGMNGNGTNGSGMNGTANGQAGASPNSMNGAQGNGRP